ncbi:hypothetical protein B0H10DRAFT_2069733 [Mycena sp. CBHHK59/15]|nr:hypothetical protein B0H10DRAFT_2069733 [Mycena sp. CBHHK59/15]
MSLVRISIVACHLPSGSGGNHLFGSWGVIPFGLWGIQALQLWVLGEFEFGRLKVSIRVLGALYRLGSGELTRFGFGFWGHSRSEG